MADTKRISDDLKQLLKVLEDNEILVEFFDLSLDLLVISGLDGRFQVVNNTWVEVLGWSKEELTSKPFFDFIHPDDIEKTEAEFEQQQREGKTVIDFENRYMKKGGGYVTLSWRSKVVAEKGIIIANARIVDSDV